MIGFEDIEYASATDVGIRRSHNQDAHVALPATDTDQWQQRGHVFLVADGMGAHAVGELASKIAVDSIPHIYGKHAHDGPVPALRKAFTETNFTIHTRGQQNREFEGMGTTATAILLRPEGVWLGHVGDSRAYRVRGDKIEQISFDHSLIWELARRQKKDPEDIQGVPSNVIIRSLGPEPIVQVDVDGPYPMRPGDIYVVCSDGLSGQVTDREIGAIAQALPPDEACRFLIHLANLQGGPDNITVVVIRVRGAAAGALDADTPTPLARPRRRPIDWSQVVHRAPWPLGLLLVGILLAGLAILLTYNGWRGELIMFLFAAIVLIGGLGGLLFQNYTEAAHPPVVEPPARPAQIHRTADCSITPALLARLDQALKVLEERIRERRWDADWDEYRRRLAEGKAKTEKGDLATGFAEQCRAMMCLMDAVGQQRHREEAFKPLWDRTPA
ncbi:MAG: protein phosphatase 2C domain-containing protein [Gemmataceae bacterium]